MANRANVKGVCSIQTADKGIKRPVKAVCEKVKPAREKTASCRGVIQADVGRPVYQAVKAVQERPAAAEPARQVQGVRLPRVEPAVAVHMDMSCIQSKRVEDTLTLQELFGCWSQEEP